MSDVLGTPESSFAVLVIHWASGSKKWKDHWNWTIQLKGDYFEGETFQ